jgi:hypothetical protein
LPDQAAFFGPEGLELQDNILEGRGHFRFLIEDFGLTNGEARGLYR